jgi:hypothetical protein
VSIYCSSFFSFYTGSASTITRTTYSTLPGDTPFFPTGNQLLAPNTSTACYVFESGDTLKFNFSSISDCSVAANVWGFRFSDLQR